MKLDQTPRIAFLFLIPNLMEPQNLAVELIESE